MSSLRNFHYTINAEADDAGLIERAVVPISGQVLFPGMLMSIPLNTPEDLAAVRYGLNARQTIIVVSERSNPIGGGVMGKIYPVGTEAALGGMPPTAQQMAILAQGRRRVEIVEVVQTSPRMIVRARPIPDLPGDVNKVAIRTQAVLDLFEHILELNPSIPREVGDYIFAAEQPGQLVDLLASTLTLSVEKRQQVLEIADIEERLKQAALLLGQELNLLEVRDEINSQVQEEMVRSQRELYLREQMRAIQTELGEEDIFQREINELHEQILAAGLPEDVSEVAFKELSRLVMMPPLAPEVGVIRSYLDWILALPWNEESEDNLDLNHAEKTLEANHYGLPKIKERILEHIAVRKLAPEKMKSPILCFLGPPGVGKTSLGKSIAQTLGREFVRLSLGGVRDEAEIRGHRRTYIGALPGRILQTMRRAGTINPVFMLDEIDKLSSDYRGDPAAALLEVLDPEQNEAFSDHYLEVSYDLSKVMFITTANDLSTLSSALEDRLEVIEFTGYTEEEKLEIARRFLIPRQIEAHGLAGQRIVLETRSLQTIIREYTYEAGVRNLEREIANVCRKLARLVAQDKPHPKRITSGRVHELLGPPYFSAMRINRDDSVGIVTGLVWTSGGGDIQTIEVVIMPGKGSLLMTGQLGDVLQESAQIALSYMRSRASDLNVPHEDFESYDVHVHMPEGSVPKEGPSAGITLAVAIISAFTERKVRCDYAMTGEITLRGKILGVGGVKEKVLAGRRNRIPHLILPLDNKKDLVELPAELLDELNITFVEDMQQVIDLVMHHAPEKRQRDLERESQEANTEEVEEETTA